MKKTIFSKPLLGLAVVMACISLPAHASEGVSPAPAVTQKDDLGIEVFARSFLYQEEASAVTPVDAEVLAKSFTYRVATPEPTPAPTLVLMASN